MRQDGRRSRRKRPPGDQPWSRVLEDVGTVAALQGALLAIAPATGLRVDVDAENGIVYLRGEVASEEQKAEAERVVRSMRIRGVREIRNELVVNPTAPPLPHP